MNSILKDIRSGALPAKQIPHFLAWLLLEYEIIPVPITFVLYNVFLFIVVVIIALFTLL
jgi:hypothetical protein